MFERDGRDKGHRDGMNDAQLNRARRPRPRLHLALLSDTYRDAYLVAYKIAYDQTLRGVENQRTLELAETARLASGSTVPKDQRFDQGWRDGFDGKDTPPKGLTYEELRTYERGHRLGAQQKEYDRANQLRQNARHQNRANAQGQSR